MASKVFEKPKANKNIATILGIGTANPPTVFYQSEYPDFYFRVTNSEHKTVLKQKFKRICEMSHIRKRYFQLTEDLLKANPCITKFEAPSLDARQDMLGEEVPKLGKEASLKAIKDWGQPVSKITHLVFCTSSSYSMPGPDFHLYKLLGLSPSIKRFVLLQQGCYVAGTGLRLAKDIVENNAGARVLVVAVDMLTIGFHSPMETRMDLLVGQAIFGDGAAAMIVGANVDDNVERGLFQLVSTAQVLLPGSEDGVTGTIKEMGLSYHLSRNIPKYIADNILKCMDDACPPGVDYNSLFYAIHTGGRAILDQLEEKLGLKEGKLEACRHVLSEYGNMAGPSVTFVLDELRKKSIREGKSTTGEGLEWGVLFTLGPGLTVETITLRSLPIVQA